MNGHRNFDVLYKVLRQREYTVLHACGLAAAAVTIGLEVLIDNRTAFCRNAAGACDKTIGIQRAAAGNGDAAGTFHLYQADITVGRTYTIAAAAGCQMLGRQAHGTPDDQVCAGSHCQRAVRSGCLS